MMLDHVTIGVSNIERSTEFYDRALRPLGIKRLYAEGKGFAGYGIGRKAFFWIGSRGDTSDRRSYRFCGAGSSNGGPIS
jgi:catechol 2,3-dioxygenase-like lactoylglutathione lyase family enzyme